MPGKIKYKRSIVRVAVYPTPEHIRLHGLHKMLVRSYLDNFGEVKIAMSLKQTNLNTNAKRNYVL